LDIKDKGLEKCKPGKTFHFEAGKKMGIQSRREYDSDVKRNEVMLPQKRGRSVPEVTEKLGINKDLIYPWRKPFFLLSAFLEILFD